MDRIVIAIQGGRPTPPETHKHTPVTHITTGSSILKLHFDFPFLLGGNVRLSVRPSRSSNDTTTKNVCYS